MSVWISTKVKHLLESKLKTHIIDGVLIGFGILLLLLGVFTWQSFNSVSETLVSVLEGYGYNIPASVSIRFRQLTVMYLLVTVMGCILAIIGMANEVTSLFEVK